MYEITKKLLDEFSKDLPIKVLKLLNEKEPELPHDEVVITATCILSELRTILERD